jgi:hypothetical protein
VKPARSVKRFSVQDHLMKLAGGFINGSGAAHVSPKVADIKKGEAATVIVEPSGALDLEVQDTSNATV